MTFLNSFPPRNLPRMDTCCQPGPGIHAEKTGRGGRTRKLGWLGLIQTLSAVIPGAAYGFSIPWRLLALHQMFCPTDLFFIEENEGAAASICFIRTDLGSITECGGVDTGGVPAQGGLKQLYGLILAPEF